VANRSRRRTLRNDCSRIWCVPGLRLRKRRLLIGCLELPSAYSESEYSSTVVSLSESSDGVRPAPPGETPARPIRPAVASYLFSGLSGSGPRKPVIYLYPPTRLLDVTVDLLLTLSWSFSAVYPPPQTAIPSGENRIPVQSLTWAVEAEPDGRLVEMTSGAEVTYLYWEAR
jgi:hypothetical protein